MGTITVFRSRKDISIQIQGRPDQESKKIIVILRKTVTFFGRHECTTDL